MSSFTQGINAASNDSENEGPALPTLLALVLSLLCWGCIIIAVLVVAR